MMPVLRIRQPVERGCRKLPVPSRLQSWVWVGGFVLAFVAGMTNIVGLFAFEHQAVSHLTGTASSIGAAIAHGDGVSIMRLAAVVGAFLLGAVVSGMVIQASTLQLGRRYGVALLVESMLLCAAAAMLQRQHVAGVYLASGACGLQNAMASTYSGAIVRTTHMTGIFTDMGILLGHRLRGMPVDWRRFQLFIVIITGFVAGGTAGAYAYPLLEHLTLLIPAALTGMAGLSYYAFRSWKRRRQ